MPIYKALPPPLPLPLFQIQSLGETKSDAVYGMNPMMKRENNHIKIMNMLSMICSILGFTSCFFLTTGIVLFLLFLYGIGQL